MSSEALALIVTAASLGCFHTVLGPDHYLPFVVMARTGRWSLAKTTWVTVLCGFGHVGSSVLLGMVGIAFGIGLTRVEVTEGFRGDVAAWALIAFGLVYCIWGVRRAVRNRPHTHWHLHADATGHLHTHVHTDEHLHIHDAEAASNLTPWILFTIFVLGPCEPLIPLLMYPAAKASLWGLALVTMIFGGATILTMLGIVLTCSLGVARLPLGRLDRYSHAFAGAAIFACGVAIESFGL